MKIWSKIKQLLSHRVENSEGEIPKDYRPECDTQFVEVRGKKIAMIQDFGEGVKVIANLNIDCSVAGGWRFPASPTPHAAFSRMLSSRLIISSSLRRTNQSTD